MSIKDRVVAIASVRDRFVSLFADKQLLERAMVENSRFTQEDITAAMMAIVEEMLSEPLLMEWVAPLKECSKRFDIGVVAAGNLPLVGFLDILAVAVSGNRCLYSLSSKDSVLMEAAISLLASVIGEDGFKRMQSTDVLDAIITTGSNSSRAHFASMYGDIPSVMRGSRFSVAVVEESDSTQSLLALWDDIFRYMGRGCRSVSTLLLPVGCDFSSIADLWRDAGLSVNHPSYLGSYIQNRALLSMQGVSFYDGGYYIAREAAGSVQPLSEIRIVRYQSKKQLWQWLEQSDDLLQCVVARDSSLHSRVVPFGMAQQPALCDWADGVDLFKFLNSLY